MLVNGRYQSVPIGNWTIEVPASFERVYFPTDILNMNKRHMVIDTERMFWRNGKAPGGMFILINIQTMFKRNRSVTLRNEMKPFYWLEMT